MTTSESLRSECRARGIKCTMGNRRREGGWDMDPRVTTIWPDEDPAHSLTFEEDKDGALWCADNMDTEQAIAAALAGGDK